MAKLIFPAHNDELSPELLKETNLNWSVKYEDNRASSDDYERTSMSIFVTKDVIPEDAEVDTSFGLPDRTGTFHTKETIKRMCDVQKNKVISVEQKNKIRGDLNIETLEGLIKLYDDSMDSEEEFIENLKKCYGS